MIICVSANPAIDRRLRLKELTPGAVNRAISTESFAGGKAAHVAMAARRLGEEVIWIGFLGGATGDEIEKQLMDLGVKVLPVRTASVTRTNDEIIDESGIITEILEPGGPISDEELAQMYDLCRRTFDQAETGFLVALSGSLPPNVPSEFYAELIALARQHGGKTILDTSGDALLKGLEASPNLVKPNIDEAWRAAGILIDNDLSAVEAAQSLQAMGARNVALSLGSSGILWLGDSSSVAYHGTPPKIKVNSTVGCGDSAVAGFAVAAMRGFDNPESLRLAVACGSANCLAPLPGQINAVDVEELLDKVSVSEIEIRDRIKYVEK